MPLIHRLIVVLGLVASAVGAHAQVGLKRLTLPASPTGTEEWHAAAWYPTTAQAQAMHFGPLEMNVAPGGPLPEQRRPLVVLSHGAGGNEWAQAWLAQALAEHGYLVVALRHPHDNQDDSNLQSQPTYFSERAAQLSRLLDALLAEPDWARVIDAQRIAAVGHSAGGATVLAMAGGRLDMGRVATHCGPDGPGHGEDAAFCAMGGGRRLAPPATATVVQDSRVRAVVAAVPVAVMFAPDSLAKIELPVEIENSAADAVLNPRYHGAAVCVTLAHAKCTLTAGAGHRAFTQAGWGRDDSGAGFDKPGYQRAAAQRIVEFLGQALR